MIKNKELIEVLVAMNAILNDKSLDIGRKLHHILREIVGCMQVKRGSIMLVKGLKNLEVIASTNPELVGVRQPLGEESPSTWVVKNKATLYIENISTNTVFQKRFDHYEGDALLVVPIIDKKKVICVLSVTDKIGKDIFSKDEQEALLKITGQIISALENQRLTESLKKKKRTLQKKNLQVEKLEKLKTNLFKIDIKEMTVLIVDDAITMCKSINDLMKRLGYGKEFFYANNGKDALKILRKEPIDFIMLDYHMPGMTGAEVLSEIRGDRDLRDLPVIMITGEVYRDYVAEAAESEIDAYILKPLNIKVLDQKVSFIVEKANNPPPMIYHLKKALIFEEEGDLAAALNEAGLAMDASPNSSRPIRELGYYYFKNDMFREAEKWLLKAAKMNHMDVFAFHYLGELYLKINDIEKAHRYFEKALEISPRHLTRGISFGKTLVHRKMIPKAIQVFRDVIKLSGRAVDLTEEIADFCMDKDGVSEYAVKLLETTIRENPKRTDLFFKLGQALEICGDIKKAIPCLIKASEIDEENIEIKIHLAKDYLSLGKPIFAENVLKKATKLDPSHREAKELLKQCV